MCTANNNVKRKKKKFVCFTHYINDDGVRRDESVLRTGATKNVGIVASSDSNKPFKIMNLWYCNNDMRLDDIVYIDDGCGWSYAD